MQLFRSSSYGSSNEIVTFLRTFRKKSIEMHSPRTISLEGGLEEFREFFLSSAISSSSVSILLFKISTISRSCLFSCQRLSFSLGSDSIIASLLAIHCWYANGRPKLAISKKTCERLDFFILLLKYSQEYIENQHRHCNCRKNCYLDRAL